jgi:hypothetical protein
MLITKKEIAYCLNIYGADYGCNRIILSKNGFQLEYRTELGEPKLNVGTALEAAEPLRIAINKAHKIYQEHGNMLTHESLKNESDLVKRSAIYKIER